MNKKIVLGVLMLIYVLNLPASIYAATNTGTYSRYNSSVRDSINELDNDPVTDIPIPVLFGVALRNITRNFGDPRNGHSHEGLDIMAPEGIPIVSPVDAVVTRTGVWPGAGNFVSTAVPGDESFVYMHLSKIADIDEGDVLKPGDVIGYVGYTGNAVASAPHLHFEIRDEDGVALDPYPRITKVFSLEEKMEFLEDVFDDTNDEEDLAKLLVSKYRSDFTTAQAQQIDIPQYIETELKSAPAPAPVVYTANSTGVLRVGSRGTAVVALQQHLIKKGIGSASRVSADGAFGPITKQALVDYQASAGLSPDGVYGPKSHAYVLANS